MITFTKTPQKYTPANNPIVFQVASDNSAIQFFSVQVQADDNSVIANLRLYTTPANRTSSFTDLSSILSNVVDYQLLPSSNIIDTPVKTLQGFKLIVTEKLYGDAGIVDGATATSSTFYTWEGEVNSVAFNYYNYANYALRTATGTTAQFLTNKPNYTKVNATSSEYLYLLNDDVESGIINFRLYNSNNQMYGNYVISGITFNNISRIDVSPKTISDQFAVDISSVKFYTVQVSDRYFVKSKLKVYTYENDCSKQPVEIVFANKLGGFDGFSFYSPRETIDVTKTTITQNPYKFDGAGNYTNVVNAVMNESTQTINVSSTSKYKLISDPLSDLQTIWLKELIQSPKVYVKLANNVLMPVQITNTNYPVLQKKFSTSLMRLEIEITAPTGIDLVSVPNLANNYSPPTIPYIEVDAYCFDDSDTPSFGYIEPDNSGNTIA